MIVILAIAAVLIGLFLLFYYLFDIVLSDYEDPYDGYYEESNGLDTWDF